MKIGIELNNVLRDINKQIVHYYKKDINRSFDDKSVNFNKLNVIDDLPFEHKKDKYNFIYIDYPYEIFGCAKPMHKNLPVMINNTIEKNSNSESTNDITISLFSLMENALTIQSSFFFLSKIGSRVREVLFPKDGSELWDRFDVLITTNENIVNTKPDGKKVILIRKDDNKNLSVKSDLVYDSLFDLLEDEDFLLKLKNIKSRRNNGDTLFSRVMNKIKKMF